MDEKMKAYYQEQVHKRVIQLVPPHMCDTHAEHMLRLMEQVGIIAAEEMNKLPRCLKVKREESAKEFPLMQIAKEGDVGLDLPCAFPAGSPERFEGVTIEPGKRHLIPTGIRLEIPEGYWASIEARSSTSKRSLIVPKGVIDEGYRGELFAQIINVGTEAVHINHGDRLIQLIMHKRHIKDIQIVEVDELSISERGESGFGSTGR